MPQRISEEEIRQQVLRLMSQLGISPALQYENLILDGEIHRYVVEGDRRGKKNGAYCIFTDGLPAGFVQDWKRDVKTDWKYDTSGLTSEERAYYDSDEYRQKAEEERKKREAERKQKQLEASEHARILFESLKEAPGNHKYLQKKQIYSYGLRINEKSLAVPLRDIQGIVRSIQWIQEDGTKRFYSGASTDGLFWSVALDTLKADTTGCIYLCEGMATGAKAYELTNTPTVAALTCANLTKLAEIIRNAYPKAEIVILADDDRETENNRQFNPGLREAAKAVKAGHADVYISPPFESIEDGTDWDDYALKYGDEACARELERTYETARITQAREKYHDEAQRLGVMSGSRLLEFCRPYEGKNFIIDDWLPTESMMMLFAPSGSGKGFLVCDMAYAVSNPLIEYWHGKKINKHGAVVYVAGEGQRGMKKRLAGLISHKGLSAESSEMAILTESVPMDDKNAELGIRRLIANIGMYYPEPALIILDTVNTMMSGDENKTSDATAFINAGKRLMQEFHCTVLNIHHTGLNPEAQGRARGSSVFKAAMDVELSLSKNGQILTLEMKKSKDTDIQNPLVFDLLSDIEVPEFYKDDGTPETTCVIELNESMTELFRNKEQNDKPAEKISKAEQFARDTYQKAAEKFGILLKDEELQREVVSVLLEDWKEAFYEMSSADKDNVKRALFSKARKILLEDKKFLYKKTITHKEYYCLTPSGDAYEGALLVRIRKRSNSRENEDK